MKKALIFLFLLSNVQGEEISFIAMENNSILIEEGNCDQRRAPCSTFKIAISLMGYDTGILKNENAPSWNYQPHYVDFLERWKKPHDPTLWLQNSCIWYSQIITQKLGKERFDSYVESFAYGNLNTAGRDGDGLTNCWLSSSLQISAKEQLSFLNKLIESKLPVSAHAHTMTKNILFLKTLENGWQLFGKTGNGYKLDDNDVRMNDRQIGWFIGFITNEERVITFAYLLLDDAAMDTYASIRAKNAAIEKLTQLSKRGYYNEL